MCKFCNKKFFSEHALQQKHVQGPDHTHKCNYYNKVFLLLNNLWIPANYQNIFKYPYCSVTFFIPDKLKEYKIFVITHYHSCRHCDFLLRSKDKLQVYLHLPIYNNKYPYDNNLFICKWVLLAATSQISK